MQEVILDTDILSEILKGLNPEIELRKDKYEAHFQQLTFTSASVMEILTGYRRRGAPAQQQRASALFSQNNEIFPDAGDYRLAAEINGDLLRNGKVIGIVDPLIAACAIRRGFGVASGNTAHYEFVRQVGYSFHLENWRNPQSRDREKRIGPCADTGHWVRSGIKPIDVLRILRGRVISSQLRDLSEFSPEGQNYPSEPASPSFPPS